MFPTMRQIIEQCAFPFRSSTCPSTNRGKLGAWIAGLLLVGLFCVPEVYGQIGRTVPRETYYQAKITYYMGEYRDAFRGFQRSVRSSTRIGQKRWLDSICAYSMLGEVFYRQGNLAGALESHELAIKVHLANRGWMDRLRYPSLQPSQRRFRVPIAWGQRTTLMGELPDSMGSLEGTFDLQTPFQIGGAVNPAHMRSVDAVEVARCLAVSLRRRAELLGPTAGVSPLSGEIVSSFSSITPPAGHWVTAWVETFYGLALMGNGRGKEGIAHLNGGVTHGNFDHPLTAIALLAIGKFHLKKGEHDLAFAKLHQATLAAARYGQADVIDDGFRYLTDAHLASGRKAAYPNVAAAIAFANGERFWRAAASLQVSAAEVNTYSGDTTSARTGLNAARVIMARRDLIPTDLGARLNYVDAITHYRDGNTSASGTSLTAALGYMERASLHGFHLSLLDTLYKAGRKASFSEREAELLYSILLREPRSNDWRTKPLETISVIRNRQSGHFERWFELLVKRKELDKAIEVAELLRRQRFYSALPFGGRVMALRWLFDGGEAMLGPAGMKRQAELRDKYTSVARLSRRATQLQELLREDPLLPDDEEIQSKHREHFAELAKISVELESKLNAIALLREPARYVFPPQPPLKALQRAMREDQAVLKFVATSKGWHAWFIRRDSDDYWPIRKPAVVRRAITELLREIGNRAATTTLNADDLNEDWKESAATIWKSLIGELPENGWDQLDELVVIPDGPLWYLPFEVLQVPPEQVPENTDDSTETRTLSSLVRVRYTPVMSLTAGDRRGRIESPRSLLVGGKLYPRDSSEHAREMLGKLKERNPELEVAGKQKPRATSRYTGGIVDRLIVWNEIETRSSKPFAWSPAQYDRGKNGSTLADWIRYPWGAPDQMLLPGYRTLAEAPLNRKANGREIFLSACSLMANGTRTALLGRWRTGGRTPAVLLREFTRELSTSSASEAWRTASELSRIETLDPSSEPRVKSDGESDQELTADHPFFWSGYLLLDTGYEPEPAAEKEAAIEKEPAEAEPAEAEPVDDIGPEADTEVEKPQEPVVGRDVD